MYANVNVGDACYLPNLPQMSKIERSNIEVLILFSESQTLNYFACGRW